MGTADFDVSMTLRGTTAEIRAMLNVIKKYSDGDTPAYFTMPSTDIGDNHLLLDYADDDELDAALEEIEDELVVTAGGPYGNYFELNDVDIFRDMAKAAPNAGFEARIEGFTSYDEQSLDCELKDGKLHISTMFLSNEEGPDAYGEYFTELLSYDDFVELFQINMGEFDEDSYADFAGCFLIDEEEGLTEVDFEDFVAEIGEECCGLDEEGYAEALEKFRQLGIKSYEEYMDDADVGDRHEYEYDPVAGEYIGNARPTENPDATMDVNETIREYLRENGFPCDDAAIAALSVDDAYAILAGTYGKDKAQAAQDEPGSELTSVEDEPASEPTTIVDETYTEPVPVMEQPTTEPATVIADSVTGPVPAVDESATESAPATDEPTAEPDPVTHPQKRSKAWIVWLVVAAVVAVIAAAVVFCPVVSEFADTVLSEILSLFE